VGRIARLIKTEIENFIVQTVESHFGANVTAETFAPSGDDSPPLPEDRVVLVSVDGTGNFVSVGVLSVSQGAKPGERILYSRNSDGEAMAALKLLNDGKIEMLSPEDFSLSAKNLSVSAESSISVESESIKASGKTTEIEGDDIKLNGKTTELTGGSVKCKGIASPDGTGCFCGMPYCAFTGAPQTGTNVSNA
jgi:hypothetical protein